MPVACIHLSAAAGWVPTRMGGPAKSDYLNDLDEGDRIRLAVSDEVRIPRPRATGSSRRRWTFPASRGTWFQHDLPQRLEQANGHRLV